MRNTKLTASLCCILLALTSCQNETLELETSTNKMLMSVIARIGESTTPQARYTGSAPNSAEFATGDSIGIFMDEGDRVRWRLESLVWVPQKDVFWPDKDKNHTFRAFYPYTAQALTYQSVPMPSLLEQDGSMAGVAKCDFLVATTTQTYGTDGTVMFQGEGKSFKHVSSLVHLAINPKEDLAGSTLKEITFAGGNIVAPSIYSFENENVSLTPDETSDTLSIKPNRTIGASETDSIPYFFVLNEKLNASNSPITLILKYQKGTDNYTARMENFASNTLQGGNQYSFRITIKNNKVVIEGNTISPWGEGNEMQDIVINSQKDTEEVQGA